MKHLVLLICGFLMSISLSAQQYLNESIKFNNELKQCNANLTDVMNYVTDAENAKTYQEFNNYYKNIHSSLLAALANTFNAESQAKAMNDENKVAKMKVLGKVINLMFECWDIGLAGDGLSIIRKEAEISKSICLKEIRY